MPEHARSLSAILLPPARLSLVMMPPFYVTFNSRANFTDFFTKLCITVVGPLDKLLQIRTQFDLFTGDSSIPLIGVFCAVRYRATQVQLKIVHDFLTRWQQTSHTNPAIMERDFERICRFMSGIRHSELCHVLMCPLLGAKIRANSVGKYILTYVYILIEFATNRKTKRKKNSRKCTI